MTYVAASDRYQKMPYRRCGRSGIDLPEVSLGLWQNFGYDRAIDVQREILRRAFDLGVTHFDLANNYGPPYGSAETNFGQLMREDLRPYRDELIISTKAGYDMWPGPYGEWGSRKYLLASLNQSLSRMGTPLLIHQPSYSMLNRWIEGGLLDVLGREGVGCIAFSPLAQGVLTGKYLNGIPAGSRATQTGGSLDQDQLTEQTLAHIRSLNKIASVRGQSLAQLALAWALRDERVTSVLIGASSVAQLEENLAAVTNTSFSDEELAAIDHDAVESGINIWAESSAD